MNSKINYLLFLFTLIASSATAQVIGDDAIRKVQSGQVTFEEGMFSAFLADTVSPEYAASAFKEEGIETISLIIKPVTIQLLSDIDDSTQYVLENKPGVMDISRNIPVIDSTQIRNSLRSNGIPEGQLEASFQRLIKSISTAKVFVTFDYNLNEADVKRLMGSFRNLAYSFSGYPERSAVIKSEPGKEYEMMQLVEKLSFVESTALIGRIE